jgi:hypothetical protein
MNPEGERIAVDQRGPLPPVIDVSQRRPAITA